MSERPEESVAQACEPTALVIKAGCQGEEASPVRGSWARHAARRVALSLSWVLVLSLSCGARGLHAGTPGDAGVVRVTGDAGLLHATWDGCSMADDYTIYEGDLDALLTTRTYNHGSVVCTDLDSDLSESFTVAAGNRYVLVVPRRLDGTEGDYGAGRPIGVDAASCGIVGQELGPCVPIMQTVTVRIDASVSALGVEVRLGYPANVQYESHEHVGPAGLCPPAPLLGSPIVYGCSFSGPETLPSDFVSVTFAVNARPAPSIGQYSAACTYLEEGTFDELPAACSLRF